jgi:hypothetical protein
VLVFAGICQTNLLSFLVVPEKKHHKADSKGDPILAATDPKVIYENFAMLLGLSKLGNAAGVV